MLSDLGNTLRGIDRHRVRRVLVLNGVHLVFLQGDQRRDDDGGTLDHKAGDLVDGRFAGTGRLDNERVMAIKDRANSFSLPGTQGGESQLFARNFFDSCVWVFLLGALTS